jgi:teichuronic acid biosynthesis glycosyltransferase TuaC
VARVAVITTSFPRSEGDASGHFVLSHARAIAQNGEHVTVLAAGDTPRVPFVPGPSTIDVRWLGGGDAFGWPGLSARIAERPSRLFGALPFPLRAARALTGFDRVVAHWIVPCAFPASLVAREVEVWAHGADVRLCARFPRSAVLATRALLRRGARFVFVSAALESDMQRLLPASLGAELSRRSRVEAAPIEVPARETLTRPAHAESPYVVWVGRLVAEKRPLLAAKLAAEAGLQILFVGDGPLSLPASAKSLGRLPRAEALRYIAFADALVSTSLDEGSPTVVREARALGTRVVAFPAGDLAEKSKKDPEITLTHDDAAFVAALRALPRRRFEPPSRDGSRSG